MYKLNIGAIIIKLSDSIENEIDQYDDHFPEETTEYKELMLNLQEKVYNSLDDNFKCGKLSRLNKPGYKSKDIHLNYWKGNRVIESAKNYLLLDTFLKGENRIYPPDMFSNINYTEKFKILYNYKMFACYGKVDKNESFDTHFQIEARDLLLTTLNNDQNEEYSSEIVPPCPLHPDIWIEFIDTESHSVETSEYQIIHKFPKQLEDDIDYIIINLVEQYSYNIYPFLNISTLQNGLSPKSLNKFL